jgi:hypothetical protein
VPRLDINLQEVNRAQLSYQFVEPLRPDEHSCFIDPVHVISPPATERQIATLGCCDDVGRFDVRDPIQHDVANEEFECSRVRLDCPNASAGANFDQAVSTVSPTLAPAAMTWSPVVVFDESQLWLSQ